MEYLARKALVLRYIHQDIITGVSVFNATMEDLKSIRMIANNYLYREMT